MARTLPGPPSCTAAILCGGAARRMGRDKAALAHPAGGTLLARTVALGLASCASALLLSGDGRRYGGLGLEELADARRGQGSRSHAAKSSRARATCRALRSAFFTDPSSGSSRPKFAFIGWK